MDLPKEPTFQVPVRVEPAFSTKALLAGTLGSLCIAVGLVMISSMVILRRQWVERERLVYPLVQVPLAMVQSGGRGEALGPFFKRRRS